jgi:hypothetical protein
MSSQPEYDDEQATAAETRTTVLKHNIEKALAQETQEIHAGRLKDENPLDTSQDFRLICEAARRGVSLAAPRNMLVSKLT